jgi:hypothetical protein
MTLSPLASSCGQYWSQDRPKSTDILVRRPTIKHRSMAACWGVETDSRRLNGRSWKNVAYRATRTVRALHYRGRCHLACDKNLSEVGIFTVAWDIDRGATCQPGSVVVRRPGGMATFSCISRLSYQPRSGVSEPSIHGLPLTPVFHETNTRLREGGGNVQKISTASMSP